MYYAYVIINCVTGHRYTGSTSNLQNRIDQHNGLERSKPNSYTKRFPANWKYLYVEAMDSRNEAKIREKWLKSGRGREFLSDTFPKEKLPLPSSDFEL